MDAVKSFNAELSALYEVKPPISKAKMTAITRGAIKAIKFYKHVVQSVEKFILKCKPEYKVPGLYVIDSIVRQSRHQFGGDKDVFAPRFAKNMQQTFVNLFKCPPEDKSKIIRVLNLWQKNQVFAPEVVQPLFDLADPNNPIHKELGTPLQSNGMNQGSALAKGSPALQKTPTKGNQPQGNEVAHGATNLNLADPIILAQLQRLLRGAENAGKADAPVHFDKKLLDFDYGDDDDEVNPSPRPPTDPVSNLLANPEVIRHLQTIQQGMQTGHNEMDMDKMRKLQEMKQQEDEFDKHLAQTVPNLPFAAECEFKPGGNASMMAGYFLPPGQDLSLPPPGYKTTEYEMSQQNNGDYTGGNNVSGGDVEVITLDHDDSRSPSPDDRYRDRRRRSRSRDRSRDRGRDRDRRRRSSRERSRSRGRRHRTRSKERDRPRGKEKEKEKEKETEKDKERKKRGLPAIKKDNLSVCSTTLWVGHLSKLVHQDDLSNTFGEFGDVVSIDLIPPRGCAFIVMHRRQDAARCLNKLKNHVLHGKAITLAWAPGKGVKGKDLKDYWEGDLGVSYIPWNKLKPDIDIEMLEDGGMIDEDTMPEWMKNKVAAMSASRNPSAAGFMLPDVSGGPTATVDTSQPPPMPGAGLLQPPLLPLVSPFQFNNRLLGPVGMNVPPGMMPNIPIGVPPPNMSTAMMSNQLLGLNSPFQGAAGLMQQMPPMSDKPPNMGLNTGDANMKSLSDTLMNMAQPFGMVPQPPMSMPAPHDDNMDVEMEDAEKSDKPVPLSEQLQASLNQFSRNMDGGRDDRGRRRSRSRDRDRDHNRDRDRRSRDRDRRDRDNSRGSAGRNDNRRDRRDDRRDRPNRWGERDNSRRDGGNREGNEDRRDREKSLNDRLQEMAGMTERPSNDRPPPPPPPRERNISPGAPRKFPHDAPPEVDIFIPGGPPKDFRGPPDAFRGPPDDFRGPPDDFRGPPEDFRGPPDDFRGPPGDFRGPPGDFGPPIEFGPPNEFGPPGDFGPRGPGDRPPRPGPDGFGPPMRGPASMDDFPPDFPPDFNPRMNGPPMMGPPDMMDGPMDMMDGPPHMGPPHRMHHDDGFRRGGRRDFRDDFDPRMRGPPGPDFFPPRDDFGPPGPRGPHMRVGPDFGPRGPPMMRGDFGPRGPRFGPRGPPPHMRPRGPRFDGPPGFGPRFDGPPDFFRGPGPRGPPPPGMFDEPPHMRHRGPPGGPPFDDRRRPGRPDFNDQDQDGPNDKPERRSRWGNDSDNADEATKKEENEDAPSKAKEEQKEEPADKGGNSTPLHDECPAPGDNSDPVVEEPAPPPQEDSGGQETNEAEEKAE